MGVRHGKTIRAFVGAEVIEPDTRLGHDVVRIRRSHLTKVERVSHYKVVNAVSAAEVETEHLKRPQPPRVHYLGLLQCITRGNIAVVVHVRADKKQAELPYHVGRNKNNDNAIDHVHDRQRCRRTVNLLPNS